MPERVETVIIGAGQSGLAASYALSKRGREHVVLERAERAAHVWRDERWDSFALVTPNWTVQMPGAEYKGDQPDAFMPRDQIAALLESYPERYHLPVRYHSPVTSVEQTGKGGPFILHTPERDMEARNLVVATGYFQEPKIPSYAGQLPASIHLLTSRDYRNPQSLPDGAVLVVGSGQTGCQIAEDLHLTGRRVYLSVGSAGRTVRRYRGKDIWEWSKLLGFLDRTPDQLPSPKARFGVAPQLTGARGGHSISLHQFARDGIVLLGHLQSVEDGVITLAPNLIENIKKADQFLIEQLKSVDSFIAQRGLDAPSEEVPGLHDDYLPPILDKLDLHQEGIRSVIWAGGFRFDYHWVKPALLDEFGFPRASTGVANSPGLYFVGLPWLPRFETALLSGIGEAASIVADDIIAQATRA